MNNKMKTYAVATITFVSVLMVISAIPLSSAAGAITLTPTTQDKLLTVTVDGTGFTANSRIGIGFGAEVQFNYTAYDPFASPAPGLLPPLLR